MSLDYNLEDVHKSRIDKKIFVEGARWANPTEHDYKKKVRKFYRKPEVPRRWASELKPKIQERYSHQAVTAEYEKALIEVL